MKRSIQLGVILFLAITCGVMTYFESFFTWDHVITDYLYQRAGYVEPSIKIIAIDEKTLAEYGTFGTWSRQRYADLINTIDEKADPLLYGFDIFFQGTIDEAGDEAFAEASKRVGTVHTISFLNLRNEFSYDGKQITDVNQLYVEQIDYPYPALQAVTKQGFSYVCVDQDGYVRNAYLSVKDQETTVDSFVYELFQSLQSKLGIESTNIQLDDFQRYGIRYQAGHNGYDVYSFRDVIEKKVDASLFDESIVLIGAYAPGMQDSFYVPIMHNGTQMYGVEVQANMLQSLMDKTTWHRPAPIVESIVNALLCAMVLLIVRRKSLKIHVLVTFIACVSFVLLGVYLFKQGISISLWYTLFTLIVALILSVMSFYYQEYQHKKKLTETFKRYVAPDIVEELIKEDANITLGGENREIAILFIDIRGFTSLSEKRAPEQVVDLLNHYLEMVSEAIFAHQGTLDKYIGDAAMAIYNAPLDDDDPIYHAIQSAMDMVKKAKEVNAYAKEQYDVDLGFGIGIHYGAAIVGNIGSKQRMDYTAISDAVNTASRIEGKAGRQQILVSERVYEEMKDRVAFQKAGVYSLKGKEQAVTLYEVMINAGEGSE